MAESFGVDPARYDRTRPAYPEEMVRRIIAASPGRNLLNVGCGTGIEARQFAAHGCTMLGVEPDERMAAFARERGTEVEVSDFESWEDKGRTFDAVISGTAWHWVDPVAGPIKAARVLPSGGRLALFWNVSEQPEQIAAAFAEAFHRLAPDSPVQAPPGGRSMVEGYLRFLTRVDDGIRDAGGFGALEQWRYERSLHYTREEYLDLLPTSGALTTLAPAKLAEILARVGEAIDDTFTLPYTTLVTTAQRD